MPIHDVGYRGWDGTRTPHASRWLIISQTGVRLAAKSKWVRRILFFAWLPVMYWGVLFFFVEKGIEADSGFLSANTAGMDISEFQDMDPSQQLPRAAIIQTLADRLAMLPQVDVLIESLKSGDQARIRNDVWRWLLMVFFRYPQSLLILFLIGTVAPSLISRDLRSRAFLLYFSRPIGKFEYVFGKLCIPAAFIVAVTTLPAIALYFFAIMMSPNISVIWNTWDIPFRIIAATFSLVIPTASIALMLSSLTHESRFANFSWFAVWALGHGAWLTIVVATSMRMRTPPFEAAVLNSTAVQNWSSLSLYNCLGNVQAMIFGFENIGDIWRSVLTLSAVTIFSLIILYRRVSAPIRI